MVGEQPGWAALTGQTSEEYQGFGWADAVHPDDRQPTVEEWDRCVRECATFDWEHRVRRRDGVYRTFSIRAVPVRDPDGSLREWVGVHTDVTERRERERRERFLSDLNERTRALLTAPDALAWEVVSSVGAFLGLSRFMYADVDVGAGSLSVLRDWCQGEGVDSVAGTWPLAPWGSGVLADLSADRTVVNRDYLTDARTAGAHETIYQETDIRANVTVPCLRGGEWVGVFSAQMCGAPRDWTDDEVELLETVAQRMWLSLENARLYQAAGQARTAAEEAADRMRFGLEAARMVAWDWDLAAVSDPVADLEAAPVRAYLSGAIMGTAADFLGRLHADDRGRVREALAAAVADPDAETYEIEFRVAGRGEGYERGCRWMAARGHIWRDPASGRALRISGVRWDVDEAKRAEEERAALAAKHEKIAETLQRSLLLTPREDAFSGLSVATVYEAAWDEALIGGDFVDVLAVDEGRIALVVGDVTGKGLRSATYTAEIKFVLRAFLRESANPARAMYRLNQFLLEGKRLDPDPHDAYLALAVAVLDTRTGELSCSCAGMEPCLVLRGPTAPDGSVARAEEVGTIGPLLGMGEESDYGAATTTVAVGDVVAMTTDGVTEARRGKAEFFGLDGLALSAAGAIRSAPSLKDAARAVVADALAFAGGRQQDDVCLLLAQRCG